MYASVNTHLVSEGLSLTSAISTQAAACCVTWRASIAISWLVVLVTWTVVLGTLVSVCIGLSAHYEPKSTMELAHLLLSSCEGASIFSIWVLLVADVLQPTRKGCLLLEKYLSSSLAKSLSWACLALQVLLIVFGLLRSIPIKLLAAIASISYMNLAAILGYALLSVKEGKLRRLVWVWLIAALVASVMSLGLGLAALFERIERSVPAQCIIGAGVLALRSWRDLETAVYGSKLRQDNFRACHSQIARQQCCLDLNHLTQAASKASRLCAKGGCGYHTGIHQEEGKIPNDLHSKPSDDETWKQCFLTEAGLEILRPELETFLSIRLIQEAEDGGYAEIAVTESSLPWLSRRFPHLKTEPNDPFSQKTPTEGETDVNGTATAKTRAEGSFMSLATAALVSGRHGHGLDRYYLKYTCARVLLATLVWKILLRRILEATAASRVRFLQNCIFVCLHASAIVVDRPKFLERDEDDWLKLFSGLHNERMTKPFHNPDEEIYLASLLWGLLESAENRGSSLSHLKSGLAHSSRNVLGDILNLIGVKPSSQPLHFGAIKQEDVNRILSGCKLFEGAGDVSVAGFTNQILRYVPIDFRVNGNIPRSLSPSIEDEKSNVIRLEMV